MADHKASLPHSDDSEHGVLGCLLLDNGAWPRVADVLKADDFFRSDHKLIFGAIGALIGLSKPADVITVHEQLQRTDQADAVGGKAYLNQLAASVPSAANLLEYAGIVRERAQHRTLIGTTDAAARAARAAPDLAHAEAGADAALALRPVAPVVAVDALVRLHQFAVTQEHVDTMTDTRMIWRSLIALTHLAVWSGPGGGGKTTVAKEAGGDLARDGFKVFFFQEDAAAGDLPALFEHAQAAGYALLNSTLNGVQPRDQLDVLHALVQSSESDLSNYVFFFDTLKKFADLMSKSGTRDFFNLMRALTTRGATVVALAHTNKHRGVDGNLIFEGVGDVRNDVDELLYIESVEDPGTGLVTMTIRPDKVRCAIREASFRLDKRTMLVTALDAVIDVAAIERRQANLLEDADLIAVVHGVLRPGGMPMTALVEKVMEAGGVGKRSAKRVVDRYLGTDAADKHALWLETYIRATNTRYIAHPPSQPTSYVGGV